MKGKFLNVFLGIVALPALLLLGVPLLQAGIALAAPSINYQREIIPQSNDVYYVGTTTRVWKGGHFTELCLSASCRTSWPTGGGGGGSIGWATTTSDRLFYNTLGSLGVVLSGANRSATGSNAYLNVYGGTSADYFYATSTATSSFFTNLRSTNASTTWLGINNENFTDLTGNGLLVSTNALTCATSNGSTFGCLTAADWSSFNGRISSSSLDTSSELAALLTDETGSAGAAVFSISPVFTGTAQFVGLAVSGSSTLGFASSTGLTVSGNTFLNLASSTGISGTNLNFTNATSSFFQATNFGVGTDYITDLTGSGLSVVNGALTAAGAGGGSNWLFNGSRLTPSTTVGIGVFASSTISDFNFTNATGTNATTTNLFATLGRFTTASTTFASSTSLSVGQNLRILSLADGCLNSTSGLIGSTGSACGSGSGGGSNWLFNGSRLSPSTTVGIGVFASSTIGGGTGATGLTISGGATTTGNAYVSGLVGIGTVSPVTGLTVGNIPTAVASFVGSNRDAVSIASNITATTLNMTNSAASGPSGGAFGVFYSDDGSIMASGDRLGGFAFGGNNGLTSMNNATAIESFAEQNWGAGSAYGSYIRFATTPLNSTTRTEAMRISANGNVGIGSTSPAYLLTVNGNGYFENNIRAASSTLGFASSTAISGTNLNFTNATVTNLGVGTLSGLLKGTSGVVSTAANGTDFTLISGTTCGGTDKVSAVSASGVVTCSPDQAGSGAGLSTSTPIASTQVIYGTSASTVGAEAAFTYDSTTNVLTVDSGAFTNATATNLGATGVNLFAGGLKTTNNALCVQLTGSADLCDGSDGGGAGGASDWNQAIVSGVLSPTTTVGIRVAASSTFLGALTVASSSPDYRNPIFEVATSSGPEGNLFTIKATSTLKAHTANNVPQESGVMASFGNPTYYGIDQMDQILFNGRVINTGWNVADCVAAIAVVQLTADGFGACPGWGFSETTNATLSATGANGVQYYSLTHSTANEGATFSAAPSAMRFATSTPTFSVTARIGTPLPAAASTSNYFLGFHNGTQGGIGSTPPAQGCYFTASSTQANWRAVCQTAAGTATNVDTGFASTSIPASGNGIWRHFRIDADANSTKFYMTNDSQVLVQVADISTNRPTTANLAAHISTMSVGAASVTLHFIDPYLAWRKFIPGI